MTSQEPPYEISSLKVIVCDDHDPIRKAILRILGNMGIQDIIECFDGDEAVKAVQDAAVDLIICDIYMKRVSGFDVLRHVRERQLVADTPFLVVTGESEKDDIVKAADLGADDYLLKPFQAADLEKKVTTILTRFHSPPPLTKLLRRGERRLVTGDLLGAMKAFDKALALDPTSNRANHDKALALERMGRSQEAVALLNQSLAANSNYYRHYAALADIHRRNGNVGEALEALRLELELNPKQPARQNLLAKMLLEEGDALGAVEHFRETLREDAKNRTALMGMGRAYAAAENLEKATYYFKRLRRYHPRSGAPLEALVKACFAADEPRRAEIALKDEINSHPDRLDTYVVLAKFFMATERPEDATEVLRKLLAKDAEYLPGLKVLAAMHYRQQDYVKARRVYERIQKIEPSYDVYLSLAEAQNATQQYAQAIQTLTRAFTLTGGDARLYSDLGHAFVNTGQLVKAYYAFRKAAGCPGAGKRYHEYISRTAQLIQRRRKGLPIAS